MHWDVLRAVGRRAGRPADRRAAGPASPASASTRWAIDYGLLDADGQLLGNPVHYRDRRTDGIAGQVAEVIAPEKLYGLTGVQVLPFNTIFQLVAARGSAALDAAAHALLIPDLFNYWLTGTLGHGTDQRVDDRTARRATTQRGAPRCSPRSA